MARFSEKTINEISTRLRLSDVVSEYSRLVRKGSTLWAKCPFHSNGNERTPSFKIDDDKGLYYCFGCHESGDMFTFLEKIEHMTFYEAVESLAKKAGVEIEYTSNENPGESRRKNESAALLDLYERINNTFTFLLKQKNAAHAREYLERRGISEEIADKFSLGFAPSSPDFLYDFLKKKGYSDEILKMSGLFSQNKFPYPLFVNRLMFPIRNFRGQVVAFSARDLSGREGSPKYINSPETAIYSKRNNLYGLYESIPSLKEKDSSAILCEGNFDVISMHQAGYTTAMASLGTSFTQEQAKLISRYTNKVDLLFDSDDAGQNSTDKAIIILNGFDFDIRIHHLEHYKDASEALEKEGKKGVENEFESSLSAFEYLVQKNIKRYNIQTPRGKSDFLSSFSPFMDSLNSNVEKESYMNDLALRINVSLSTVEKDLRKGNGREKEKGNIEEVPLKEFNPANCSLDLYAMLILVNHRQLFNIYRREISFGDLKDKDAQSLYLALEDALRDGVSSNEVFLSLINDDRLRNYVSTSFMLDEFSRSAEHVLDEAVDKIRLRSLEEKREVVNKQIRLLSSSLDADDISHLMEKKKDMDDEINAIKSRIY